MTIFPHFFTKLSLIILLLGSLTDNAYGQTSPPELKSLKGDGPTAQVMILGVFHFHNPNADYVKFEGINVLAPERQQEILQIVDQLAAYEPTRIALEKPIGQGDYADTLRAHYQRYRQGDFELTSNETHQLGFRLAHRFDHPTLYPVDYRKGMDISAVMQYAAEHDPELATWFQRAMEEMGPAMDRMQQENTIGATLRWMNEPEMLNLAQVPYMKMAEVGAGDTYIGAEVVADWYDRNLRIFSNLVKVAEPGERVLLIIGQGHAPILRDLVRMHPQLELVEPLQYLK